MIAYNWTVIVILQANSHDEYAFGVRFLAHALIPEKRIEYTKYYVLELLLHNKPLFHNLFGDVF